MATKSEEKALSVANSIVSSMSGSFHRSLSKEILREVEGSFARNISDCTGIITKALTRTVRETIDFDHDDPSSSYFKIMESMGGKEFSKLLSTLLTEWNPEKLMEDFADCIGDSIGDAVSAALSPESLSKVVEEALWDAHTPIFDALKRNCGEGTEAQKERASERLH